MSVRQLTEIASSAFGRRFTLNQLGNLEQLDSEIAARPRANSDPMAWVALRYERLMATGEGRLALPVSSAFISEPLRLHESFAATASGEVPASDLA